MDGKLWRYLFLHSTLNVGFHLSEQNFLFFVHENFGVQVPSISFPMNISPPASPSICAVNQGPGIIATTAILVGLTVIIVAVRFAVRYWIVKDIGWDDWTILLAMVINIRGADDVRSRIVLIKIPAGNRDWRRSGFY